MLNSMYELVAKCIWPISIVMLVIVSVTSLLPLAALPNVPGTDKTHHILSYLLIALPISIVRPKYWLLFIALVGLWSGVIEVIQPFVNRYGDWLDLVANVGGILIGYAIGLLIKKLLKNNL